MDVTTALAQYLDDLGLGTFDDTGVSGDIFVEFMPDTPGACISLYSTGGGAADAKLGYDTPSVQTLVRGGRDPRPPKQRCQDIYDAIHGLTDTELPGGLWVVSIEGIQSAPVQVGLDENNRHRFSLNYEIEVRNVSTHRV